LSRRLEEEEEKKRKRAARFAPTTAEEVRLSLSLHLLRRVLQADTVSRCAQPHEKKTKVDA